MFGSVINRFFKTRKTYVGIDCEEVPEKVLERRVYVVGGSDHKWQAIILCPCGCLSVIHLNLLKDANPNWSIKFNKRKRITVSPSIRRIVGCKSHFNLIDGKVYWH